MKVLFILHLPPPIHGAAMVGQYIRDSSVINTAFDCRYINLGISDHIGDIGKSSFRKAGLYGRLLCKAAMHLVAFRPRVVYLTPTMKGIGFYKDLPVILLVKLFGVRLICHFHNKGLSARKQKLPESLLYYIVFSNTEVILLSRYLYPDIQKYVSMKCVHYCPNGIPEQGQRSKTQSRKALTVRGSSDTIQIFFLSNLIESKGVYILLHACRILSERNVKYHCAFAGGEGDISEEEFLSKINSLGLTNTVDYTGRKYGQEKEDLFLCADIFAFPTFYHNECFPLVLLEAMQHSLPVVSTCEGGIPGIVEEGRTGFLVPQHDIQSLADRLELLINDPALRKQMGAAARVKYEREFTLAAFENRLKYILMRIMPDHAARQEYTR